MQKLKEILYELIYFTKQERIALLYFVILLTIIVSLPKIYLLIKPTPEVDFSKYKQLIDSFEASLVELPEENYVSRLDKYIIERYDTIDLFSFDPNTATFDDFIKLGLTEKQSNTIINYRQNGGHFAEKDDFRKIYGIRHKQYEILKPYILLPDKKRQYKKHKYTSTPHEASSLFKFDPNTADSETLSKLGLNTKQIKSIINYRNKGGKFYKPDDLAKIYTISAKDYELLKPFITIDTVKFTKKLTKTNINTADQSTLTQKLRIPQYLAQRIIKYRQLLGGYCCIEQLKEVYGMKDYYYNKIKNYIEIDKSQITKININTESIKNMSHHPYITYKQAKRIKFLRAKLNYFDNTRQLIENNIFTENEFRKIQYYIKTK